jgi:hypothetical protein
MNRTGFFVLLLILALADPLWSQVPEFPDSLASQRVVARTERFEGTHTTSLLGDYALDRDRIRGRIRSYLLSTTTLFGSATTKDQIDAALDLEYRLPSPLRLFTIAEGTLTNDVRGDALVPGLNNTASALVGIGTRVYDESGNRIGLAIGGAYNRQLNVNNMGLALYSEVAAADDIGDYEVRLDGQFRAYNIAPRHNNNGYVETRVGRTFEEGGSLNLAGRYDLANTDLYLRRSEEDFLANGGLTYTGLQGRGEGRFAMSTDLVYPVDQTTSVNLSGTVTKFDISQQEISEGLPPLAHDPEPFKYDRGELGIGLIAGVRWNPAEAMQGTVRMEYITSEQHNTVEAVRTVSDVELARKRTSSAQNDFVAQQLRLAAINDFFLSDRDTLSLSASVGIYRYDTPSSLNYFDRDEQSIQGEIRLARKFSPWLSGSVSGQVYLTHLVYLFGQNSNDNNWNRIIRVAPSVVYSPGVGLRNNLDAEVTANYTEYDFQGRSQNVRGRSFRELRLHDSLELLITGTLRLMINGELRIAERGSFSWVPFAESPLERTRTEGLEAEARAIPFTDGIFGAGGRLARVKTFRADPRTKVLEPFSDRTSFGPTARCEIRLSPRTEVIFSGWWEHRFEDSRLVSKIPWIWLGVRVITN